MKGSERGTGLVYAPAAGRRFYRGGSPAHPVRVSEVNPNFTEARFWLVTRFVRPPTLIPEELETLVSIFPSDRFRIERDLRAGEPDKATPYELLKEYETPTYNLVDSRE